MGLKWLYSNSRDEILQPGSRENIVKGQSGTLWDFPCTRVLLCICERISNTMCGPTQLGMFVCVCVCVGGGGGLIDLLLAPEIVKARTHWYT